MNSKVMTAVFALALIAGTAAPGIAAAERGGNSDRSTSVEATFTKWIVGDTLLPNDEDAFDMVGVVGGEVGLGSFFGEVFSLVDDHTNTTIHAVYHVNGGNQSFVAKNTIIQNDATGIAEISGVVIGGPLDGAKVRGGYRTLSTCDIATPGNVIGTMCFKGTLQIQR